MRLVGHLKKGAKSLVAGVNLTLVILIPKIDGERKAGKLIEKYLCTLGGVHSAVILGGISVKKASPISCSAGSRF